MLAERATRCLLDVCSMSAQCLLCFMHASYLLDVFFDSCLMFARSCKRGIKHNKHRAVCSSKHLADIEQTSSKHPASIKQTSSWLVQLTYSKLVEPAWSCKRVSVLRLRLSTLASGRRPRNTSALGLLNNKQRLFFLLKLQKLSAMCERIIRYRLVLVYRVRLARRCTS